MVGWPALMLLARAVWADDGNSSCSDGALVQFVATKRDRNGQSILQLTPLETEDAIFKVSLYIPENVAFATEACLILGACYDVSVGWGAPEPGLSWRGCGLTGSTPFNGGACVHLDGSCSPIEPSEFVRLYKDQAAEVLMPGLHHIPALNVTASATGLVGYAESDDKIVAYYSTGNKSTANKLEIGVEASDSVQVTTVVTNAVLRSSQTAAFFVSDESEMAATPGFEMTTDRNAVSIQQADEGTTTRYYGYRVIEIVKSDTEGDGWNGYVLRLTEERQGETYYSGTLHHGRFEVDEAIVMTDACYLVDVLDGYFSIQISWAMCDGVVRGGAPSRGVRFCIDAKGACFRSSTDAAPVESPAPWLLSSLVATTDSYDCAGPHADTLSMVIDGRWINVTSGFEERYQSDGRLVGSSLEVTAESESRVVLKLVFQWATILSGHNGYSNFGDCYGNFVSDVTITLSYDSSPLVELDVVHEGSYLDEDGDYYEDYDSLIGYSLTSGRVSADSASYETSIFDGIGQVSVTHWAFNCRFSERDERPVSATTPNKATSCLVNGRPTEDAEADCAGVNLLEVRIDADITQEVRAAFNICDSTVVVAAHGWNCSYIPLNIEGYDIWQRDVEEPLDWSLVEHRTSPETIANQEDDDLAQLGAVFSLAVSARTEQARCVALFDAARSTSATLGGAYGHVGGGLRAWLDGRLVLDRTYFSFSNVIGATVVDCVASTFQVALDVTGAGTLIPHLDLCGTNASSVEWRCVETEDNDDYDTDNWLSEPFDMWASTAGVSVNGSIVGPAHCRASVRPASARPCVNALDERSPEVADSVCVDMVEYATSVKINEPRPGVDACLSLDDSSACEATCGLCNTEEKELVIPLETKKFPCTNLSLELRDPAYYYWSTAQFSIEELFLGDAALPARDSVHISEYVPARGPAITHLCLPSAYYDFHLSGGYYSNQIEWRLCNAAGESDVRMDFFVNDGSCFILVDRDTKIVARVEDYDQPIAIPQDDLAAAEAIEATLNACQGRFGDIFDPLSSRSFELPRVVFGFAPKGILSAVSAVFENAATKSAAIVGGSTILADVVADTVDFNSMTLSWALVTDCEDDDAAMTSTIVTHAHWSFHHSDESILRVDAAPSSVSQAYVYAGVVPNSFRFGYQFAGYEAITVSYFDRHHGGRSFYYRLVYVPSGWSVVDNSTDDVQHRVQTLTEDEGYAKIVLADGYYVFVATAGNKPTASVVLCDNVTAGPGMHKVPVRVIHGRCQPTSNATTAIEPEDGSVPASSLTPMSLSHLETIVETDSSTLACEGARNPSVFVTVATPRRPTPGWCRMHIVGAYKSTDGQSGRLVASEAPTDALSTMRLEWEDASRLACDSQASCSVTWSVDYKYPSLRVVVDAEADSTTSRAGYIVEPYGLQLATISKAWREKFQFDCTDPLAVATTSAEPSRIRAAESFELWVNGVLTCVGLGWETLFEQAALPVRCDSRDVLALRVVSNSTKDVVGLRASFNLPCYNDESSSAIVVETAVDWRCFDASRAPAADLSWTLRDYNDSSWPSAAVLLDTERLDQYGLPSQESSWIWSTNGSASIVWCRFIPTTATRRVPREPTAPTTMLEPRPTRMSTVSPVPAFTPSPAPAFPLNPLPAYTQFPTGSLTPLDTLPGGEKVTSKMDKDNPNKAAFKIVGVIVGVALLIFVAFISYKPLRRRCATSPACMRIRAAIFRKSKRTHQSDLNEIMLPAFSPLNPDISRDLSPVSRRLQNHGQYNEDVPQYSMSLGARIAAFHKTEEVKDETLRGFFRPVETVDENSNLNCS